MLVARIEAVGIGFKIGQQLLVRQEVGLVGGNRKVGIAEVVAAGVDVQVAIGAGQAVVIAVAPHPADVGALLADLEGDALVVQRLGHRDAGGAGADDADVGRCLGHAADLPVARNER
jgi:hypothetical protein